MTERKLSAASAGSVSLGGELSVHRLGFGAMRLTGEGSGGSCQSFRYRIVTALPIVSGITWSISEANGLVFIPWFPLAAGTVAGEALDRVARTLNANRHQVALAWLLKRSPFMLPISGTSSIAHLEENVGAAALRLNDEQYQALSPAAQAVTAS